MTDLAAYWMMFGGEEAVGPTLPATPASPTAVGGDASATVTWVAPADGGSPLTGYTVTPYVAAVAQTPKTVTAPATSTTVTGLTNGTAYTFKVKATNAVGTGADSAASNTVTPAAAGSTLPVTSGLAGWWDADDAASITASAGAVSQWNDKSGSNRHVTQATGASRPVTGSRTMNGRNVLDFTAHYLQSGSFTLAQPITVFAVVQPDVLAGPHHFLGWLNSIALFEADSTWSLYAGAYLATGAIATTSPHVVMGLANGASSQIWVDGVSAASGDPGVQPITNGVIFGAQQGGGNVFDGSIAEMVMYDRVLSTPERQQVEAYLKTKWGTP